MKKGIGEKKFNDKFSYFVEIINIENDNLNFNVVFCENDIDSIIDKDIFFKSGCLLMLLYIFNCDLGDDIKYKYGSFYVKNIKVKKYILYDGRVENIINNIIEKSVYSKRFLPLINKEVIYKNFKDIELGFSNAYNIFINNKLEIIKVLDINEDVSLINMLKILNLNDLNRQLKFLRFKFKYPYRKDSLINQLIQYKNIDKSFIDISCVFLDNFIKKSIIGVNKYGMETMWIQENKGSLTPSKYNNIYIYIYLKCIGEITNNKYYLEIAKQTLNPLLEECTIKYTDESEEYWNMLKFIYFNSEFIEYDNIKIFIENNKENISTVSLEDKGKYIIDNKQKLIDIILNKSLIIIRRIIL